MQSHRSVGAGGLLSVGRIDGPRENFGLGGHSLDLDGLHPAADVDEGVIDHLTAGGVVAGQYSTQAVVDDVGFSCLVEVSDQVGNLAGDVVEQIVNGAA